LNVERVQPSCEHCRIAATARQTDINYQIETVIDPIHPAYHYSVSVAKMFVPQIGKQDLHGLPLSGKAIPTELYV